MARPQSASYELDISGPLFGLATQSVRLHSNETFDYQTVSSLVCCLTARFENRIAQDSGTIREHLSCFASDGAIKLRLDLSRARATRLIDLKRMLRRRRGVELTISDALSVLLLDYVAWKTAERIVGKLGLEAPCPSSAN